jgi:hypothetical protein
MSRDFGLSQLRFGGLRDVTLGCWLPMWNSLCKDPRETVPATQFCISEHLNPQVYSLLKVTRLCTGFFLPRVRWMPAAFSPGVCVADVDNGWSYTFTCQCAFVAITATALPFAVKKQWLCKYCMSEWSTSLLFPALRWHIFQRCDKNRVLHFWRY